MKTKTIDLTKSSEIIIEEDTKIVALFIGKENAELTSVIDFVHNKPNLNSDITIKAVLYDRSRFDIEGNLIINKGAKNTDTYLKIDVLMMSEKASARAVPSLEIEEDEVKGGHGATVGEVDQDQIFYLMSRGLSRDDAEEVLVEGFIGNISELTD